MLNNFNDKSIINIDIDNINNVILPRILLKVEGIVKSYASI